MHNRAHSRHYRSEYVRGYLHRQADVYSLPGWSQWVIPYIYRVIQKKSFFFGHYIIKQYFCYTFFSFICRQYIKKEIIMEGIYIIFAGIGIVALALYLWSSYTKSGRKWLESL